jgi:uncharacterized protein (TIGR00299 family) protein
VTEQARCLIFDPFSGISGNMVLGGLVDLGLPVGWLEGLVDALPIDAEISATRVARGAIRAVLVTVRTPKRQPARRLDDVLEIVEAAPVDPDARAIATAVFRRLAEAEAEVHGLAPDQIHFHEVGAADALVDVIGAASGVRELGVERCLTRPVAVGRGWVSAEHGRLPIPAPATLKLLEGLPVHELDVEGELTTPTGAALLAVLTGGAGAADFIPARSGFGAGRRDPAQHPNCLRLVLADEPGPGDLCLLQADLDDMSPEYLAPLRQALGAAGAVDVWEYPVRMKKGRSGLRVEALVPVARREAVAQALFLNSTTLGLRSWRVEREVLPRTTKTIEWRGFSIRIKTRTLADGHVALKPEYEDVVRAAHALGLPPLRVREEIERLVRGDGV